MSESLTISLPSEVWRALNELAQQECKSVDELVGQALKGHLFSRRFRLLRDRLAPKAQAQGVVTDKEVFERVS